MRCKLPAIDKPPIISEGFAAVFRLAKSELVVPFEDRCEITQSGGAYTDPSVEMPPWPVLPAVDEAVIETFVADTAGGISATSNNQPFIDAWLPLVAALNRHLLSTVERYGVQLDGPAYVTASLTPAVALEGTPHVDDDQYIATEGVGLVAICGDLAGPRVACRALPHAPLRSPTQMDFGDNVLNAFAQGDIDQQQADADRIIVFPQFGQLHAGAVVADPAPALMRNLLVLRAKTLPG